MVDMVRYWNDYHKAQNVTNVPIEYILDKCQPFLDEGYRILEFGCGSGNILASLIKRFQNIYACDISKVAISRIDSNIKKLVKITVNQKDSLPYEADSMDLMVMSQILSTITDQESIKSIIKQVRKTIAKNMFLLIIDYVYSKQKNYSTEDRMGEVVSIYTPKWSSIPYIHYRPKQYLKLFSECNLIISEDIKIVNSVNNISDGNFSLIQINK